MPDATTDLSRIVRMVKVTLGVNVILTVVNAAVLYGLVVYVVAEPARVEGVDPFGDPEEREQKGDPREEMRDFFDRMTDLLDRAARKHGTNPGDVLPTEDEVNSAVESRTMHSDESQALLQKLREGFDLYELPWPTVIPER